jgi:hypothetical protein
MREEVSMDTCVKCGHELTGRFCTNCGHPAGALADEPTGRTEPVTERTAVLPLVRDDWRSGTAERPAVPGGPADPPMPPPPVLPPSDDSPRFPLFADEVPAGHPPAGAPHQRRTTGWVPWAGVAALLLLVAAGAFWLLGGDGPGAADRAATAPGGHSGSPAADGKATDVARLASVQVPATAPPNQDVSGNVVRYEGRNMLDGVAQTCWRMIGDGTGKEVTLTLEKPTRLTTVGLINGYAKVARDGRSKELDWYHGNRRVLMVQWTFDDGTTVTQDLADTNRLQTVDVGPVTTQTVRLKLVSVSEPGTGRAARNNTAISDVSLVGSPA